MGLIRSERNGQRSVANGDLFLAIEEPVEHHVAGDGTGFGLDREEADRRVDGGEKLQQELLGGRA
jgi:hypothetical protein